MKIRPGQNGGSNGWLATPLASSRVTGGPAIAQLCVGSRMRIHRRMLLALLLAGVAVFTGGCPGLAPGSRAYRPLPHHVGDRFRYYVFDETKTDKLHYEHAHDFTIYAFADPSPRLVFYTEYRIYGCAQETFTYSVERCECEISRERFNKLITAIREIPPRTLQLKEKRGNEVECTHGMLELNGTNHHFNAGPTEPNRAKLHTLILAFLDEVAPKASRKITTRTIEGDLVVAHAVAFETLLGTPEKFDGKRVRLTGYYHAEFEGSNFGPRKNAACRQSVWLGGDSTFATPANIKRLNDTFITAEGTFDSGPGGHMGLWPGELHRVTRLTKAKQ